MSGKLTSCMKLVNSMDEQDQDALLDRLSQYQKDGIKPERAQLMAASDTLAELEAERKEFMAMLREQHPDIFRIKPGNDEDADDQSIKKSRARFYEDIPNEDWLQGKIDYARKAPRNQFGVPKMGSVTGYFKGNVMVPVRWAKDVPGQRGEQSNVRQGDLEAIRAILRDTGKMPLTDSGEEYVPYIEIGHDGEPWVSEGNHRIMAAAAEGWDYIPAEVRYFDGGQRNAGKWNPKNLLEITERQAADIKKSQARDVTKTPEFKRWFGDSKVVDADGKPLVVYHGSGADIKAFKPNKQGLMWLTSDPNEASSYAFWGSPWGRVYPVYLSVSNPYPLTDEEMLEWNRRNEADRAKGSTRLSREYEKVLAEKAKSAGHDGLQLSNGYFAALSPAQIKSATGNNGQFDPANPDIRKSARRQVDTPEFKRWFGDSKVVDADGKPLVVYHGTRGDFAIFKPSRGDFGDGIYTTSEASEASDYANDWSPTKAKDGANVMPVYVSLQNPYYTTPDDRKLDGDEIRRKAERLGHDGIIRTWKNSDQIHAIAFNPTQIKSAIGNSGEFDPGNPDIRKSTGRNKLGFYSALAAGIDGMPTKAAPAGAWKAQIKGLINKGAVKQDEVTWSGLEDWMDLQEGKITKEQIAAYLEQGGVSVEETVLGKQAGEWRVLNDGEFEYFATRSEAIGRAKALGLEISESVMQVDGSDSNTKYSQYTLPGGENYREVLLTLPKQGYKPSPKDFDGIAPNNSMSSAFKAAMMQKYGGETFPSIYSKLSGSEVDRYEQIIRQERQSESNARNRRASELERAHPMFGMGKYKSSHWDQPNVLAHIRVNDRTDADGNKVLFVEEVQSDWGQDGKKKGFKTGVQSNGLPDGFDVKYSKPDGGYIVYGPDGDEYGARSTPNATEADAVRNALRDIDIDPGDGSIPKAPFVTKTDGWLNLALKRIVAMAVDGGYDKVAFVNGEQSADRYDLSKSIESIGYDPKTGRLQAYDKSRMSVIDKTGVSEDQLEDYIGKEVAQRLLATEPMMGKHLLDGEQIKVGGEGMKTFYDSIVPNAVKKLISKMDGKLETVTIEQPKGKPTQYADFAAWQAAPDVATLDQPGFTITPKMQEQVSGPGQALFSRTRNPQEDTQEFIDWSEGAPVVRLGERHEFKSGQPVVVEALHGTTNSDLTEFKRERANIESDWGAGFYASNTPDDVATNYANNDGADLTQRIELMAERLAANEFDDDMEAAREEAKRRLTQESPNTLKLYVRMSNPAVQGGKGETFFDYTEEYDEETDSYAEPTGLLVDFVESLRNVADEFDGFDADAAMSGVWGEAAGEGIGLTNLVEKLKASDAMIDVYDEDGNVASSEVIRRALEDMGFDGVIDTTVSTKFKNMKGMNKDTVHFIAFDPTQLKSATGNNGAFGRTNRDITKSTARNPQVDTKEFRDWFGDSKVVDANGKPLVVYHGGVGEFTSFRPESHFGSAMAANKRLRMTDRVDSGAIVPVYLSIKNPKRLSDRALTGNKSEWDWAVDTAKLEGYDGIVYDNKVEGGESWIAFSPTQIKSATGNQGTFDPKNPDIRKSTGRTATGADWDSPSASKFDDMVYKLQDKHVDLKRVTEAIKAASGALADDLNVYLQEELYHGRAAKRTEDFVNMELNPLIEQMKADGLEIEDVEEFLHARHAPEANKVIAQRNPGVQDLQDGGSGMKTADALDYMNNLDPAMKAKLEAAADKVDAIIKKTREMYVDYELESKSTVDAWDKMFDHYIPLQREDKEAGPGLGQGFSVKGKETKGRTGSTRKVVHILANIATQREKAIVRGEKNRVSQALVGMVKANPNEGFWTVDEVPTERVFNPKTGLVEDRVDPLYKSRPNAVVAKIADANGQVKEHAVVFNEDDPRAMRMAESLKNLDAADLEGVLGVFAKISRYFAATVTQWNPVFGVVNLIRDVQGVALNLSSTPLQGDQGKVMRNTWPAIAGIYSDLRAARRGQNPNSQWAALFDEFQEVGGQTGYRDLFKTSADRGDTIKDALDPDRWTESKLGKIFTAGGLLKVPMAKAKRMAGWIFDFLSDYNDAFENGVRLAVYKAGLDRGLSKQQAASIAKNASTNFNRKGQIGPQAGALYAFFNASVQGTARIGQTLLSMEPGNPKSARLSPMGKKIVAGGLMLGTIQAMLLAAAGHDDEDPPQFARERGLIIPIGDKKYITIPMPLGFNVIPNLSRIATEFAMGGFKDPHERALQLFGLVTETFSPIGNSGLSMQTLAPTALDPLVALTENKDWTGKPIARESSNQAIPGHALAKDTATTWSKAMSEAINTMSGGNKYTAGVLSPTPDQIDYLLAFLTGGVGKEISKLDQTVMSLAYGEELPPHKIPLAGRFFGNSRSQSSEGSAFYANTRKLNELETEIKGLKEDGKHTEAAALRASRSDAYLIAAANQAERQIQRLRSQKRELIKSDAPRERVKAVEEQITAAMARLNRSVEALEEKSKN